MDGTDRRAAKTLLDYWQLLLVLCGGIVACVTFWNNMKTVIDEQKSFKATVETRREKSHQDMEDIRSRITKLEVDMDWMRNK